MLYSQEVNYKISEGVSFWFQFCIKTMASASPHSTNEYGVAVPVGRLLC